MSFFKSWFGEKTYLGVDIGTTSIKIAEVAFGGKTPRIVNYALLESRGSLARANTGIARPSTNDTEL